MHANRPTLSSIIALSVIACSAIAVTAQSGDVDGRTLVMGQPTEQSVGDWREIGRAPETFEDGSYAWLGDLRVVADQLVSLGGLCQPDEGACADILWRSSDATTWTQAEFAGSNPAVRAITTTPEGLVAVGSTRSDGTTQAAVWTTADGVDWAESAAPPVRAIESVAASGESLVVTSGKHMWVTEGDGTWQQVKRPLGARVAAGPGGFLAYRGGGQDRVTPSALWRSSDGLEWRPVKLPRVLRKGPNALGELQLFPLTDGWILIPDRAKSPTAIFTSSDGVRWQSVPRPPKMSAGVSWVEEFGDLVQAHGLIINEDSGLWTWPLGDRAQRPTVAHDIRINRPVAWQDGYVAVAGATHELGGRALMGLTPDVVDRPSAATGSTFEVGLSNASGDVGQVVISDGSGRVVSATSGNSVDGASVRPFELDIENITATSLRLTWVGGPCESTDELTIDVTGQRFTLARPECAGDAVAFDRVLLLEFAGPITAEDIEAVVLAA